MYSCWEIFIYRYEMCKEFSEPSTKWALMQPKIRESSNISFNIITKIFVNTDSWDACLNLPFDISRPVALRFYGLFNFNTFLF